MGQNRSIHIPKDEGPPFDLHRGNMLSLVKKESFKGRSEYPNEHTSRFNLLCSIVTNVGDDKVKLMLFLFTLRRCAYSWLEYKPHHHFTIWEQLSREFVKEFFMPAKT